MVSATPSEKGRIVRVNPTSVGNMGKTKLRDGVLGSVVPTLTSQMPYTMDMVPMSVELRASVAVILLYRRRKCTEYARTPTEMNCIRTMRRDCGRRSMWA